ncbi:HAD-superfamily hydrolase, subfamily IA, variant 3 [Emticicia oligotrophica DSM 17448]|uniref:HAD-superfamily hydrolase, subfamily IA, variant 3 n=1 Tax=Emticicia oligotrophica (strain DSM 17448 / CIP 109782 / MTCC 6937 / GPTSA100-15) TaxID=929562 RepID=A0ABM5MZH5_EMTOG|nr:MULTISPECIES: HAD family phosphatase [Emticicia]AFK02506.1 HAD-superfamily hydrolase, subfamily IA, variant 3 [Emticicia oligotrophica DSM 17448]
METPFAVIFDMDGVICDTNPYHSLAWKAYLDKHGIASSEEEFIAHMYGKSNSYILKHFFKREIVGEEFARMEFEKEALFREIYDEEVKPISGLLTFIEDLKANGVKTGIATSAPYLNMELILSKLPLREKMESLLSSEDVTAHKPNPEVYLKSAQNLGIDPAKCVVFEDSFSGVTAGKSAGAKVVGVLSTYKKEELPICDDYIVNYEGLTYQKIKDIVSKTGL